MSSLISEDYWYNVFSLLARYDLDEDAQRVQVALRQTVNSILSECAQQALFNVNPKGEPSVLDSLPVESYPKQVLWSSRDSIGKFAWTIRVAYTKGDDLRKLLTNALSEDFPFNVALSALQNDCYLRYLKGRDLLSYTIDELTGVLLRWRSRDPSSDIYCLAGPGVFASEKLKEEEGNKITLSYIIGKPILVSSLLEANEVCLLNRPKFISSPIPVFIDSAAFLSSTPNTNGINLNVSCTLELSMIFTAHNVLRFEYDVQ